MLYLILAIACSAVISVIIRISKKEVQYPVTMYGANYVTCEILGLIFLLTGSGTISGLSGGEIRFAMLLGFFVGLLYPVGFILMRVNIINSGMALTSVFSKLGVIVPTLLSIVLFHENPSAACYVGIAIAVAAIIVMGLSQKEPHEAGKHSNYFWLVIHLLCGGITETANKLFDEFGTTESKTLFLLMIFGAALLFCVVWMIISKGKIRAKDAALGVALGIPNYFTSRLILGALETVPAVVVFPVFSVGTIVAITLIGFFYKEKLNRTQVIGIAMILLALVLLNL
ncbi:MAG: EamA family transporter [Lachnospiraceae bacterium]|nr:EamA family transporter [Lachnospiraceae bacterium]